MGRNRLTVNNILMNAALHNVTRRGGIAPRLINSNINNNPLLNSALALSHNGRLSSYPHITNIRQSSRPRILPSISSSSSSSSAQRNNMNSYLKTKANPTSLDLLQQQSLLSQQAALNRLRAQSTNPLLAASTINNNINLNTINMNNMNNSNNNSSKIPQELLDSTINELKEVMTSSSDSAAVTNAINAAFTKLGANDPDSKRKVLEQLVEACQSKPNLSQNDDDKSTTKSDDEESRKKSKKKRSKSSKSKKSKKKKKDKDRKHSKSSKDRKDRKHRHRRKRDKENRSSNKDRSRSRDRRSRSRNVSSEN